MNKIAGKVKSHNLRRLTANRPRCWQDGFLLANGSLGALVTQNSGVEVFFNKAEVIDGRCRKIKRIIDFDTAKNMVDNGASVADFAGIEHDGALPEGYGPKTCAQLTFSLDRCRGNAGLSGNLAQSQSVLDIYNGELNIQYDKHLAHPKLDMFTAANANFTAIKVSNVPLIYGYRNQLYFFKQEDIQLESPQLWIEDNIIFLKMNMPEAGGYVAAVTAIPKPSNANRKFIEKNLRPQCVPPVLGKVEMALSGHHGIIKTAGDFELFVTVVSDLDAQNPATEARRILTEARKKGYKKLMQPHRKWWHNFWQKSYIEIADKTLEEHFYRSLYYLGANYRHAPMPGLLGLSYGAGNEPIQASPWGGDLHMDQNIQTPFFGVHAINHGELSHAYVETIKMLMPEAQRIAQAVFNVDGAHFDAAFNIRGKSIAGGVGHYRFLFMGSYVGVVLAQIWEYTLDKKLFATELYPLFKEIIRFYENIMTPDAQGILHLYPAPACELNILNMHDSTQVISMLKYILKAAIPGAMAIGEIEQAKNWQNFLAKMPPYVYSKAWKDRNQTVISGGSNIPPDHYVSQANELYPVYPCNEIYAHMENRELLELYNRTFENVRELIVQKSLIQNKNKPHYQCVWQCFYLAVSAIRLGRKQDFIHEFLPLFIKAYSKPNGMFSHDACMIMPWQKSENNLKRLPHESIMDAREPMSSFEVWSDIFGTTTPAEEAKAFSVPLIEASGDYITLITESMLSGDNGLIRLFPAWDLKIDAAFENWKVQGDIYVSAVLKSGKLNRYTVSKGKNCQLSKVKLLLPGRKKPIEIVL